MKDCTIVINTLGRASKQITWNNLPDAVKERTVLSVQYHEKDLYPTYPITILPEHVKDLPTTRQWLIEMKSSNNKLIIMDDDLSFFHRAPGDHKHLHKNSADDTLKMFSAIVSLLDDYAMVGVSAREGNNRVEVSTSENTRSMRIFGLDLNTIREIGARFDRTKTKEDMDMTLQLLRAGHKNIVLYNYANDHVSSNAPGGCALYRTLELMEKDAHTLAALHPGFVKVVKKKTKTSWNGQERTDVIVQWKKAFSSSFCGDE